MACTLAAGMVAASQVQARDAEARQMALSPVERVQSADGHPRPASAAPVVAMPAADTASARGPLPAGALLFALTFWGLAWLTDRRAVGRRGDNAGAAARHDLRIGDGPASPIDDAPPGSQVERRRRSDRRD